MDFMGIGPLELLLILLIGFLLLGPDKLPGMAAKTGRLFHNFRKATSVLSRAITEEVSTEKKTISEDLSTANKAENGSATASKAESDQKSNVENSQRSTPLESDEKAMEKKSCTGLAEVIRTATENDEVAALDRERLKTAVREGPCSRWVFA